MKKIRTRRDLSKILLKEADGLNYSRDSTGVKMARWQSVSIEWEKVPPYISLAVREIEHFTMKRAIYWMVNRLPPDVVVPTHTDTLKRNVDAGKIVVERWHLPLKTNPLAEYWDEALGTAGFCMEIGFWHGPIPYWVQHNIWNAGTEERVHLIVDLE